MFLLLDRLKHLLKKVRQIKAQILRACLVGYFKQLLEHFKHTNTHFYIPGELIYEQYEGYGAKMARSQNIRSFDQFFFL